MKTLRWLATAGLLLAGVAALASPTDPQGRWITASGNLEVEIAPCGSALCGTVTRVLGNRSMAPGGGEMQPVDARPALGMRLLEGLQPVAGEAGGSPVEWRGTLYNRENGKTYRCVMTLTTAHHAGGQLRLRAYVGLPLFGQTQTWQRAPVAHEEATAAEVAARRATTGTAAGAAATAVSGAAAASAAAAR